VFAIILLNDKDRFDTDCDNLRTYLMDSVIIYLRSDLIDFISGNEYKEIWHEMTSDFK